MNGGSCEESSGYYSCYCLPGFTGDTCSTGEPFSLIQKINIFFVFALQVKQEKHSVFLALASPNDNLGRAAWNMGFNTCLWIGRGIPKKPIVINPYIVSLKLLSAMRNWWHFVCLFLSCHTLQHIVGAVVFEK